MLKIVDGGFHYVDEPALTALNMRLRDDYVADLQMGMDRWNRAIARSGIDFKVTLPHVAFHRAIGEFANIEATPQGELLSAESWAKRRDEFLPSSDDATFIQSLMEQRTEPGQFATWIAAPRTGINNQPGDFEYVQLPH